MFLSLTGLVRTTLGLVLRTPDAVLNLGFVILFPLTFVSDVFVEPATMPAGLRAASDANPVTHLTDGGART